MGAREYTCHPVLAHHMGEFVAYYNMRLYGFIRWSLLVNTYNIHIFISIQNAKRGIPSSTRLRSLSESSEGPCGGHTGSSGHQGHPQAHSHKNKSMLNNKRFNPRQPNARTGNRRTISESH